MSWIVDIVAETKLADTHEHLVEESRRLSGVKDQLLPCDDWALLFKNYLMDDFHCAGMSSADENRFYDPECSSTEKLKLILPFWERVMHTGYAQALSHTIRELYGIESLTLDNVEELASKYHETKKPGYYNHIITNVCHISECHVNSLERIFMETAQPSLLRQDISIVEFSRCNDADIQKVEAETGITINSLDDWLAAIDGYFDRYGKEAVAVKYWGAYHRRLKFEHVQKHMAEKHFLTPTRTNRIGSAASVYRGPTPVAAYRGPEGVQALEDYLFHYCLKKAQEYGLPVKLHTGYFATRDYMPLSRVRDNATDVCRLLQDYPNIRFVLMHIGYPYQDEYISLCKQYKNAYVDLCWAWIINPIACVRFLLEFLVAAPAHKILTFGGDFVIAENIVGHAVIARKGIAESISALVDRNWIDRSGVAELVARLMNLNARELFVR